MRGIELYHGSSVVVQAPSLSKARPHNDFGLGFYTTRNRDLACEWACQRGNDGYVNRYALDDEGLKILDLLDGTHTTLEWLALLLDNRRFDLRLPTASMARDWLVERFKPNVSEADVVVGYRADDSYFSFARAFVENALPLSLLDEAMRLGDLGEQVVLVSEGAFQRLRFVGYSSLSADEYYPQFVARDTKARSDYRLMASHLPHGLDDLYMIDILRQEVEPDDPRLSAHVSFRR